jgi:hypothetical protein
MKGMLKRMLPAFGTVMAMLLAGGAAWRIGP